MTRGHGGRLPFGPVTDFEPLYRADLPALHEFLRSETWPYHGGAGTVTWIGAGIETWWVLDAGARAGVVRLYDLDDGPMFDLRLRSAYRGRGIGTGTVRWLTGHLFDLLPEMTRIEATTREDNVAMARVLERCGYVREARYREAWPVPGGPPLDALGYAILRREWAG